MREKETTLGGVVGTAATMCSEHTAPLPKNQDFYHVIQAVAVLNLKLDEFSVGVNRLLATALAQGGEI